MSLQKSVWIKTKTYFGQKSSFNNDYDPVYQLNFDTFLYLWNSTDTSFGALLETIKPIILV